MSIVELTDDTGSNDLQLSEGATDYSTTLYMTLSMGLAGCYTTGLLPAPSTKLLSPE